MTAGIKGFVEIGKECAAAERLAGLIQVLPALLGRENHGNRSGILHRIDRFIVNVRLRRRIFRNLRLHSRAAGMAGGGKTVVSLIVHKLDSFRFGEILRKPRYNICGILFSCEDVCAKKFKISFEMSKNNLVQSKISQKMSKFPLDEEAK